MKLLSFSHPPQTTRPRLGAWHPGGLALDLPRAAELHAPWLQPHLPPDASTLSLLHAGPDIWSAVQRLLKSLEQLEPGELSAGERPAAYPIHEVQLHSPLARPPSLRDFYAFEQHMRSAFANRGRPIPPEWYQAPVFYFSNPGAIFGPGAAVPYPSYSQALDYELEVACIIGKAGIDISAQEAESYIFGYTILNDWSARDEQRREMSVGLGPAKGKDFASSLGPWIVTADELSGCHAGRPGVYNLEMRARVNGVERSRGNWKTLYFSFGDMIERASRDVWLAPGDVLGSGTVGSGCLLELTAGQGPWLQPGDRVELEIEALGVLDNTVAAQDQRLDLQMRQIAR